MKKYKVLICIPGLNIGGVDKALISFCNKYHSKLDISLLIFGVGKELLNSLPDDIKLLESTKRLHILTSPRKKIIKEYGLFWFFVKGFFYIVSRLFNNTLAQSFFTKTLSLPNVQYDYAISWSNDGNEKTLCFGSEKIVLDKVEATKKILYMHNDIFRNKINGKHNNELMNKFDYIWCISESVKKSLLSIVIEQNKLILCHCFVDCDDIIKQANEPIFTNMSKDVINFVTVCRLSSEKGIDRGLNIFSKINQLGFYNFHWFIIGGGDVKYKKEVATMPCRNNVTFLGAKENPYPYIKNADVYLSLSRYEGAPIVFLEAKTLNKKILSTEYISSGEQLGPYDMVMPNDDDSIKNYLVNFLANPSLENCGRKEVDAWNERANYEISEFFK